jgi:aminomethyltransferase
MTTLKRTPLFEIHQKLGGRMVEFGGWEMPVQYTSIVAEHQAVRNAAGIFDISHMGEFFVSGNFAEAFLNHLLTNDIRKLSVGQGQYTLMCNERGGVVDDLYVYRIEQEKYLLIVNASRIDEDFAWLTKQHQKQNASQRCAIENESDKFGAVAIQGPRVAEFIDQIFSVAGTTAKKVSELKKNEIAELWFGGGGVLVSRTGYTGEDGFEVVASAEIITEVWSRALEIGKPFGLVPAGLGARDTLRTEVCYPLYGHELDENTTPIEAGVGFFVALDKGDFFGRSVLAEQKAKGISKKCVAFKMTDKSAPPRPHYPIWSTGTGAAQIGEVVSGTQSPTLNGGIGMGYVKPEFAKAGTQIEIEIRGKRYPAIIVAKPIYKKLIKP